MTAEVLCPGLPASWLSGWLAAIGGAALVPAATLRWSDDPIPLAVFATPDGVSFEESLCAALPTAEQFAASPIARRLAGCAELKLNPSTDDFAERARAARTHRWHWMLSSLYTDARRDRKTGPLVDKGPFVTPMPGVDNTMYDRVSKLLPHVNPQRVSASLQGVGARVQQFGIGFDVTRLGSLADVSDMYVDPVIELLTLFGLSLFPTRGNGYSTRQRGWGRRRTDVGDFRWFAWSAALNVDAIDAWLDVAYSGRRLPFAAGEWQLVPFQARGSSDVTRGFGSHRVS